MDASIASAASSLPRSRLRETLPAAGHWLQGGDGWVGAGEVEGAGVTPENVTACWRVFCLSESGGGAPPGEAKKKAVAGTRRYVAMCGAM